MLRSRPRRALDGRSRVGRGGEVNPVALSDHAQAAAFTGVSRTQLSEGSRDDLLVHLGRLRKPRDGAGDGETNSNASSKAGSASSPPGTSGPVR